MVRRYQIRLMRSVNARCVSIGLVLALSNCSESGGEPDAMLDMHHPGTGIDSHHPQFHNSYGNMKFIIIVINPTPPSPPTPPTRIRRDRGFSCSRRFSSPRGVSFHSCPPLPHPSLSTLRDTSLMNTANKFRFRTSPRTSSMKGLEKCDSRPSTLESAILPPSFCSLPPPSSISLLRKYDRYKLNEMWRLLSRTQLLKF